MFLPQSGVHTFLMSVLTSCCPWTPQAAYCKTESSTSGGFNSQTSLEKRETFFTWTHWQHLMHRATDSDMVWKKQCDLPCVYVINHVWSCIRIMKNLLKKEKKEKVKNYKTKYRIKYRLPWGQSQSFNPCKHQYLYYWKNVLLN